MRALEGHLRSCEGCSAVVAELRQVKSLVSRLPQVEPSRSFVLTAAQAASTPPARPSPRRPYALAPAVALTLLVALLVVDFGIKGSTHQDQTASTPFAALSRESAPVDSSADAGVQPEVAVPAPDEAAPTVESGKGGEANAATVTTGAASTAPEIESTTTVENGASSFAPVQPTEQSTPLAIEAAPATAPTVAPAAESSKGNGISLLRVLEIVTGAALLLSTLLVFGPRLLGKRS